MPNGKQIEERMKGIIESLENRLSSIYKPETPLNFSQEPEEKILQLKMLMNKLESNPATEENPMTEDKFQSIARRFIQKKDGDLKNFMKLDPKYRANIICDYASDDPKVSEQSVQLRNLALSDSLKEKGIFSVFDADAEANDEAIFNPVITKKNARNFSEFKELKAAQEKKDNMDIKVPEGLDYKVAKAAVYSATVKNDSIMKIGRKVNTAGGSSTAVEVKKRHGHKIVDDDYMTDGATFLFDNVLSGKDSRYNAMLPYTLFPKFRQEAKTVLESFDRKPAKLGALLQEGFTTMLNQSMVNLHKLNCEDSYLQVKMTMDILGAIEHPLVREHVALTDDQIRKGNYIRQELSFMEKSSELESELSVFVLDSAVLGNDKKPADDPEFIDKYLELQAIKLHFARRNEMYSGMVEPIFSAEGKNPRERNLMDIENELLLNPEQYLASLKKEVRESMKESDIENDFHDWKSLAVNFKNDKTLYEKIVSNGKPQMVAEFEAIAFKTSVDRALESQREYLTLKLTDGNGIKKAGVKVAEGRSPKNIKIVEENIRRLEILQKLISDEAENNSLEALERRKAIYDENIEYFSDCQNRVCYKIVSVSGTGKDAVVMLEDELTLSSMVPMLGKTADYMARKINAQKMYTARAEENFPQIAEEAEKQAQAEDKYEALLVCGQPAKNYYKAMLKDLSEAGSMAELFGDGEPGKEFEGLNDAMNDVREGLEAGGAEDSFEKAFEKLEAIRRKLDEKMLNDDSEKLMQQYSRLNKMMLALENVNEAPDVPENSGNYQKMYDDAQANIRRLDQEIETLRPEGNEPETTMYQLAVRAKQAFTDIREAVSAECFGENGIEHLKGSDVISVISTYQTTKVAAAMDPEAVRNINRKTPDELIRSVEGSPAVERVKDCLNVRTLAEHLSAANGFMKAVKNSNNVRNSLGNEPHNEVHTERGGLGKY